MAWNMVGLTLLIQNTEIFPDNPIPINTLPVCGKVNKCLAFPLTWTIKGKNVARVKKNLNVANSVMQYQLIDRVTSLESFIATTSKSMLPWP